MLASIDADLKLVIAGNHDISLDEQYYERKGPHMHRRDGYDEDLPAKAKAMWRGAQEAGVTYLEEGTHDFTLQNGAKLRVRAHVNTHSYTKLTRSGVRIALPARVL